MKYNEKLKEKIALYHQMLKEGKDTTAIKAEIDAYTKQVIEESNTQLNAVREDKHAVEQKELVNKNVDKEDYNRLIELFRKSKDLMYDISKYKKHLRELNKVVNPLKKAKK